MPVEGAVWDRARWVRAVTRTAYEMSRHLRLMQAVIISIGFEDSDSSQPRAR